jgi:chromate reductase
MKSYKIAVLVGSLRKESYNLKMTKALIELAPASLTLQIVNIGELALYNEDLEATPPAQWKTFREQVKTFEGVLFVTPEYNRSVPAVLKNAIDVGSRPRDKSVWDGKPAGVVSVTTGKMGGFGANHHLRQSLVFINVAAMPQPEAYIGGAAQLFDGSGHLINESTKEFMKRFMEAFAKWVETNSKFNA